MSRAGQGLLDARDQKYVPEGGVFNKVVRLKPQEMRWWGGPEQQVVRFTLCSKQQLTLAVGEPALIEMSYQKVT